MWDERLSLELGPFSSDLRILVDCRYLGRGGPGRATELLLRGLRDLEPPGRWILWGPDDVRDYMWSAAEWHRSSDAPTTLFGQRELLQIPGHDLALYMHQVRPLRRGPSVTLIHDTIPLRYGGNGLSRQLKRTYLRRLASITTRIVTVSRHSRRCIARDLLVQESKIDLIRYPIDEDLVYRVKALRAKLGSRPQAIYVGRFGAHKNLPGLVRSFQLTELCRRGGELLFVGGSEKEVAQLSGFAQRIGAKNVKIERACPQSRLEELYATSALLIMPSYEEGFGMPAWEALYCGLPICVSDGGSLAEIFGNWTTPFPATSFEAMAAAIDRTFSQWGPRRLIQGPSIHNYAASLVHQLALVASNENLMKQ